MRMVGAAAKAKRGPLRDRVAKLGLNGIDVGLRARWEARVNRAARIGGIPALAVERQQSNTTVEFSNEAMLEARATEAAECVAAVR